RAVLGGGFSSLPQPRGRGGGRRGRRPARPGGGRARPAAKRGALALARPSRAPWRPQPARPAQLSGGGAAGVVSKVSDLARPHAEEHRSAGELRCDASRSMSAFTRVFNTL